MIPKPVLAALMVAMSGAANDCWAGIPEGAITSLGFVNQSSTAISNRYVTFGHAFAYGDVPASKQLVAKVGTQEILLQVDKKTSHRDGSLKFAVLTAKLDSLGGGQSIQSGLFTVSSAPVKAALNSKRRSSSFQLRFCGEHHHGRTNAFRQRQSRPPGGGYERQRGNLPLRPFRERIQRAFESHGEPRRRVRHQDLCEQRNPHGSDRDQQLRFRRRHGGSHLRRDSDPSAPSGLLARRSRTRALFQLAQELPASAAPR